MPEIPNDDFSFWYDRFIDEGGNLNNKIPPQHNIIYDLSETEHDNFHRCSIFM